MALAAWWYEDGHNTLPFLLPGMAVVSPENGTLLASVTQLTRPELDRRRRDGHRAYLAFVDGEPAASGWVATQRGDIGELGISFELPPGNRYLWDFVTLPAFRGRGIYPALLAEITRRESPPATRLWIIHAPENVPSGVGIGRAGFVRATELSFDAQGRPALEPAEDRVRAEAAAALLRLPLRRQRLDRCWTCGGCTCDPVPGGEHRCSCATLPVPRQGGLDHE